MNDMSELPAPAPIRTATTYDARDLIGNDGHVCILLDGQEYFLRITRAGKLILTK